MYQSRSIRLKVVLNKRILSNTVAKNRIRESLTVHFIEFKIKIYKRLDCYFNAIYIRNRIIKNMQIRMVKN